MSKKTIDPWIDEMRSIYEVARNYPLLSREQEKQLAILIEAGGEEAKKSRETFLLSNVLLVVSIAKKYRRSLSSQFSFLEIFNQGFFGLVRALEKFDYRRGYKFSTYAQWWIRQSIQRITRIAFMHGTHVPYHMYKNLGDYRKQQERWIQRTGRKPTPEETLENFGFSKKDMRLITRLNSPELVFESVRQKTTPSFLLDAQSIACRENLRENIRKEVSLTLIDSGWSQRDCRIVMLYFGLETGQKLPLEEIGTIVKLTKERVRQIKNKTLPILKSSKTLRGFAEDNFE